MMGMPPWTDAYWTVCRHGGWADVSARSKVRISGPDARRFLHNFCTNDLVHLPPGRGCEAFVTTAQGRTLALARVFACEEELWLDLGRTPATTVLEHLSRYWIRERIELADETAQWAQFVFLGPAAWELLLELFPDGVPPRQEYGHLRTRFRDFGVQLRRSGPPDLEFAFQVLVPAEAREAVEESWTAAAQRAGLAKVDRDLVEALRIESGAPESGVEVTLENFPQEFRRDERAISYTKGCYLGQETVARIQTYGHVNRYFVRLKLGGPWQNVEVKPGALLHYGDREAGKLTSIAFSPAYQAPVALGYVRRGLERPGTKLKWCQGEQRGEAEVLG